MADIIDFPGCGDPELFENLPAVETKKTRTTREMRELIQRRGPELIEELFTIIGTEGESTKNRLKAISMLLDRGYGRPVSVMEMAEEMESSEKVPPIRFIVQNDG